MEEARGDAGLRSDVDLVREMYDAVGATDISAVSQLVHPDVVWEHNPGGGSPEEGVYHGRDEVVRLFERILEPWEYLRVEPEEIKQVGEGVVLVKGELYSKHATTAAEIVTPYEQRFEIQDGLVVRGRMRLGMPA